MADNRKYYYLKLKDNFFDREELKLIESLENGFIYSNLYMKICLLSIKNDGKLMFRDNIPYDPKMLATVTGVPGDSVKEGVRVLITYGLLEKVDGGALFVSDIQELIGHSSTEAERKKAYRLRITTENSGTLSHSCPTQCLPEIEREIDTERELEIKIDSGSAKASPKNPHVTGLIKYYIHLLDKRGLYVSASFPGGQAGIFFKRLLKTEQPNDIAQKIKFWFRDDWGGKIGFQFGAFQTNYPRLGKDLVKDEGYTFGVKEGFNGQT